jgi:hypothetical protein
MMSGWLRYLTLKAQSSTGLSTAIAIWAVIALIAAVVAIVFLLAAADVALADRFDPLIASLILAGVFIVIALAAALLAVLIRRSRMESARLELAARSGNSWLDPKLVGTAYQIGQSIGWRRIASLAAVAVLAAGLAQEWRGREHRLAENGDDAEQP